MHLVLCSARLSALFGFGRFGLASGLALLALDHRPALELGDRLVLFDRYGVTDAVFVVLVVGWKGLRPPHRLLHHWMSEATLDPHDNGFVLLVAHHHALQRTLRHLILLFLGGALLLRDGLDAGDVAPHFAHAHGVLELSGRALEAQIELLLLELEDLVLELVEGHGPGIGGFHRALSYSAIRAMKRVLIGSLAAASVSASRATSTGTPSTSNMMRPGFTRQTQNSGVPLPLPMRTSIGFFD